MFKGIFVISCIFSTAIILQLLLSLSSFSAPPSIVTSGCQFAGFNPSDDTFGIYLTANVSTGAPSAILCSVNTQSAALDSKIFREVFRTESPTEAGVNIVTSVPRSSLPGTVTCTISNSEGSDSFTCNLRGMYNS